MVCVEAWIWFVWRQMDMIKCQIQFRKRATEAETNGL